MNPIQAFFGWLLELARSLVVALVGGLLSAPARGLAQAAEPLDLSEEDGVFTLRQRDRVLGRAQVIDGAVWLELDASWSGPSVQEPLLEALYDAQPSARQLPLKQGGGPN